jgi:hypothetical protein
MTSKTKCHLKHAGMLAIKSKVRTPDSPWVGSEEARKVFSLWNFLSFHVSQPLSILFHLPVPPPPPYC